MKKFLPILRNSPFFKGLTDDEILSILHCVEATTVSKERDSYIFRAADSTEVMGLVVSGCVLVIQEDLWGHRNILSKCHAGDFFGEPYAASPGAVLNISVVADEDCEIIFLNVQKLLVTCPTACGHHQKLIRNLVSVLANKILILNDKITHVGKRTTRDKLLSYLSAESIRHSSLSFDIPRTNGCVDRCNQTVCLNETKSSEAGSDDGWDQISDSADTESDENGCKYDQSHGTVLENHQQQCDEVPYTIDDGSVFCVFCGMVENQFLCINSLVLGRSCYFYLPVLQR